MQIFGNSSKLVLNGKTYVGNNIVINNDVVIVDGKVHDEIDENRIEVSIICNVDKIISDESIYIKGNVTGNIEATNVNCNDVKGNVIADASVNCHDIIGDASAGAAINCNLIKGNASAAIINKSSFS